MFFKKSNKKTSDKVFDLANKPLIERDDFDTLLKENFFGKFSKMAIDLRNNGFCLLEIDRKDWVKDIDYLRNILIEIKEFKDDKLKKNHQNLRFQDAWNHKQIFEVQKLANEKKILDCLRILYGREPFPFQTLNFPYGSQQHVHSDAVHFNSIPFGFMCGVWVALEDVTKESGPLIYYPFSHKNSYISSKHLGITNKLIAESLYPQIHFEEYWRKLIKDCNYTKKEFLAKKGQVFIWHANLLHGGEKVTSLGTTRWSQVTHYYFRNCCYYTPFYEFEKENDGDISKWREPCDLSVL